MGLLDFFKKNSNNIKSSPNRELKELVLPVVGVHYYMDNIKKLACSNADYKKNAKTIANSELAYKTIYQYTYINKPVKLIPEPQNKHDKNAVAVYIAGELVGYISREENIKIKKILQSNDVKYISSYISGGKYKIVRKDATVEKNENSIHINIKIGYV